MKTYENSTWTRRIGFGALTFVIALGGLELVAGSMRYPDADASAARAQFIAAESNRAQQIRTLEHGELRVAEVAPVSAGR